MSAAQQIVIPYDPRPYQWQAHERMDAHRFGVIVAHRRFGKSVAVFNQLQKEALQTEAHNWRGAFIGPTYTQAKAILWDHAKHYAGVVPGVKYNESELRVDYPNGSRIRLFGADNYDSLRGLYFDLAIFDEFDLMRMEVWGEVVRPALIDRGGKAFFIGTYKEENGPLGLMTDFALGHPEEWFFLLCPASETGVVSEHELQQVRETLTEEEFAREMECKRIGAVKGSILGRWIDEAQEAGRIAVVDYDPQVAVTTAWDLGMRDPCAIWFVQQVGPQIRAIDYHEASGEGLEEYARVLQEKRYVYREHLAPFDINVRELGAVGGRSRYETAMSLGIYFRVLPQVSKSLRGEEGEQIHAARTLLPRVWFDAKRCAPGLRALRGWHFPFNKQTGSFGGTAVHDWASHGAKAFCYLALGIREVASAERPQPDTSWIR